MAKLIAEFDVIGKFGPGLLVTESESVSFGQQGVSAHRPRASGQHLIKPTFQANWENNITEPSECSFQMRARSNLRRYTRFKCKQTLPEILKREGNQNGEESKNPSFQEERPKELRALAGQAEGRPLRDDFDNPNTRKKLG